MRNVVTWFEKKVIKTRNQLIRLQISKFIIVTVQFRAKIKTISIAKYIKLCIYTLKKIKNSLKLLAKVNKNDVVKCQTI